MLLPEQRVYLCPVPSAFDNLPAPPQCLRAHQRKQGASHQIYFRKVAGRAAVGGCMLVQRRDFSKKSLFYCLVSDETGLIPFWCHSVSKK